MQGQANKMDPEEHQPEPRHCRLTWIGVFCIFAFGYAIGFLMGFSIRGSWLLKGFF